MEITLIKTNDEEGQSLSTLQSSSLQDSSIKYIDVAEELFFTFDFTKKGNDKQKPNVFYYVRDYGELDEVPIIEPKIY
jgi:hypothetical protein